MSSLPPAPAGRAGDLSAEQRMFRDRGGERPERARTDPGPPRSRQGSTGGGSGQAALGRPLDPPPFRPATVRRCIRSTVRIHGFDAPEEVLILTTVNSSMESFLRADPDAAAGDGGEGGSLCDSDFSDSFDTSSSDDGMSCDRDDDSGGNSDGSDRSAPMDDEMEVDNNPPPAPLDNNNNNGAMPPQDNPRDNNRMKAFLKYKRPLCENRHGVYKTYIYYARVLQKADSHWIATDEEVAIKEVSWETVKASRSHLSEDFLKEVVALQYISDWHSNDNGGHSIMDTHVLAADTIMSNDTHLYIVMPYCRDGDLFQLVAEREEQRLTERESRDWFQQVLKVRSQKRGVGISSRQFFGAPAMRNSSLVLQFFLHCEGAGVSAADAAVSQGLVTGELHHIEQHVAGDRLRHVPANTLLARRTAHDQAQAPLRKKGEHITLPVGTFSFLAGKIFHLFSGKRASRHAQPHVAPEIWQQAPFDGHAVDLWAAGTILLFLLTGMRLESPFHAERILHHPDTHKELGISFEAMELLRAMLRLDPRQRLSFEQVQNHRWVQPEFM